MSVKLLDNNAFYGYRVRRSVGGKLYQEYFSLKEGGKRIEGEASKTVEAQAQARDQELADLQKRLREEGRDDRCFRKDGTVRGISYLVKMEKSGALTPIFQVGIASDLDKRVVCTSFSINAHGVDEAWSRAVDVYAKHKQIAKNSALYGRIMAAQPSVDLPE